jgi:hypothetical protein
VDPANLTTFPTYSGVHEALGLEMIGRTWGDSLDRQGMSSLAMWANEMSYPSITGFIIDSEKRQPADGYFKFYGKDPDADGAWWLSEVAQAKLHSWPHLTWATKAAAPTKNQPEAHGRYSLHQNAQTVVELVAENSRFFLKSEWGPISSRWPALSFSKRSVGDYLNREYNPARDFIVYAGTGNPERTKEAEFRKRLLSILITEPGQPIPTEDLVPWESWQAALTEHDKAWPHSFGVRAAWSLTDLPGAGELTPKAYRSLGIRSNWGGVVEILGAERTALLPLRIEWVELPNRGVVQTASAGRDRLRDIKADPSLNSALTRMALLIQARLGGPRSVRREVPGRTLPVGTNLVALLHKKWIEQNQRCALCDQLVRLDTEKKLLQCSPDRKDSKNPSYGDDNLQITHLACNLAKNDGTTEDFEEWLELVSGELGQPE